MYRGWSIKVINKEVYIYIYLYIYHIRKGLGVTDVLVDELKKYLYIIIYLGNERN